MKDMGQRPKKAESLLKLGIILPASGNGRIVAQRIAVIKF